ncbi:hypothetical protein [Actinomadura sp. NPDC049753]|uniref:hypothetical protein n=1 Tax=Actinomadura sp. NPDC049753 TaxID=3154739 RepID=UPI00344AE796
MPDRRIVYVYESTVNDLLRWTSLVTVQLDGEAGSTDLVWTEQVAFLARAVEHLRLIAAGLQIATVRTQLNLSLINDFESFTTFVPTDRHTATLHQMLTEVIEWSGALAPLRAA